MKRETPALRRTSAAAVLCIAGIFIIEARVAAAADTFVDYTWAGANSSTTFLFDITSGYTLSPGGGEIYYYGPFQDTTPGAPAYPSPLVSITQTTDGRSVTTPGGGFAYIDFTADSYLTVSGGGETFTASETYNYGFPINRGLDSVGVYVQSTHTTNDNPLDSVELPTGIKTLTIQNVPSPVAAPEISPVSAASELTLLLGCLAVLRGRRPRLARVL